MRRLTVLISNKGMGTNLQAIIDGVNCGKINGEIVAVISDTKKSQGLERARKYNLPIVICPKKENLLALLKKYFPDFICLAGWKQIITDDVIDAFPNRILNIHPGLIPNSKIAVVKNPDGTKGLWNKGKLTDSAIKNYFNNHKTYAGSSLHFLTKEFDFGPVLGRCFEKIKPDDTIAYLYKRLKKKENKLYVKALNKLCKR